MNHETEALSQVLIESIRKQFEDDVGAGLREQIRGLDAHREELAECCASLLACFTYEEGPVFEEQRDDAHRSLDRFPATERERLRAIEHGVRAANKRYLTGKDDESD